MSKLFLESLDKKRLEVFHKLKNFRDVGVLGGGTALALQIGHRISFDFDIFTFTKLTPYLWTKSRKIFGRNSYRLLDTEYQLNLATPDSVYVTFFHDEYKSVFKPIKTGSIDLLDLRDIAANKAFTIGRRPKWRDYVDLFFLLKNNHLTMANLMFLAKKKFGTGFSEKLFFEQLIYWEDIDNYKIEFLTKKVQPEEIKKFLEAETKKYISGQFKITSGQLNT